MPIKVTINEIKHISIINQGLHNRPSKISKTTVLSVIKNIGLLQLDSINYLIRSHYIILFSRLGLYDIKILEQLQFPDKKLIEQWFDIIALIPTSDLQYIIPMLAERRRENVPDKLIKAIGNNYSDRINEIHSIIKKQPLTTSKDLTEFNPYKQQWWSKKPSRRILDFLFRRGYITVEYRDNFSSTYAANDLLKNHSKVDKLSSFYIWAILRSVEIIGIASIDDIVLYYRLNKSTAIPIINLLLEQNKLISIYVDELSLNYLTTPGNIKLLNKIRNNKFNINNTTVLSPFDNLIWSRKRTELIFNFNFKSEMYLPKEQRKFGYYVLPILHKENLVARINLEPNKRDEILIVEGIYFENRPKKITKSEFKSIIKAVKEFSIFIGFKSVYYKNVYPKSLTIEFMSNISK